MCCNISIVNSPASPWSKLRFVRSIHGEGEKSVAIVVCPVDEDERVSELQFTVDGIVAAVVSVVATVSVLVGFVTVVRRGALVVVMVAGMI